jgi:hypothetical protein
MKKFLSLLSVLVLASSVIVAGCDDCDSCIDDYCDCLKNVDEDNFEDMLECAEDAADCIKDNDCDEDDFNEGACD